MSAALAASALLLAIGQGWVGQAPFSPATEAAIARAKAGDAAPLLALAEAGDASAQFQAGTLMIFGARGVPKDGARGCAMLKTAGQTRADAMHIYGECLQFGYGGEQDLEKAMAAFDRAGDMGLAKSRCAEGNILIELQRDVPRAVALCREAAEAGDADAQTDLGNFYIAGVGVEADVATARGWYEKAAAQNQRNAAFVLGQIHWNGDGGVERSPEAAARYWRIAHDNGRPDAAFWLGNAAYLMADAGDRTWDVSGLKEAERWYALAAERGPEAQRAEAAERLDLVRQLQDVMSRRR